MINDKIKELILEIDAFDINDTRFNILNVLIAFLNPISSGSAFSSCIKNLTKQNKNKFTISSFISSILILFGYNAQVIYRLIDKFKEIEKSEIDVVVASAKKTELFQTELYRSDMIFFFFFIISSVTVLFIYRCKLKSMNETLEIVGVDDLIVKYSEFILVLNANDSTFLKDPTLLYIMESYKIDFYKYKSKNQIENENIKPDPKLETERMCVLANMTLNYMKTTIVYILKHYKNILDIEDNFEKFTDLISKIKTASNNLNFKCKGV